MPRSEKKVYRYPGISHHIDFEWQEIPHSIEQTLYELTPAMTRAHAVEFITFVSPCVGGSKKPHAL